MKCEFCPSKRSYKYKNSHTPEHALYHALNVLILNIQNYLKSKNEYDESLNMIAIKEAIRSGKSVLKEYRKK